MRTAYTTCLECPYVNEYVSNGPDNFDNYLLSLDSTPEECVEHFSSVTPANTREWCQTSVTTCDGFCSIGISFVSMADVDQDGWLTEEEFIAASAAHGVQVPSEDQSYFSFQLDSLKY